MKKIKSYTSIWAVEKVIYAINDFHLPFPVTFNQMAWFVLSLLFVIVFAHVPPLSVIEGAFLRSFISYHLRFKVTFAGKKVKEQKKRWDEPITLVRSVNYVPD